MDEKKIIEEMAKNVSINCDGTVGGRTCFSCRLGGISHRCIPFEYAKRFYKAGYRKESDTARDIIADAKKWVKEHHKDKVTDSFGKREMLFMEAFGCLLSYLMEKYVLEGKENGRID